jgi:uncharacterized membrane protein YsdA (DUF1294 family)
MIPIIAAAYLLLVNVAAFGALALDKAAAESGRRRIAESTLLLLALAGGSPGAWLAVKVMRHKTRKQPFRSILIAIVVLQVGVAALLLAKA